MTPKAKICTEKLSVTPIKPHISKESHFLASKLVPLPAPQTSLRPPILLTKQETFEYTYIKQENQKPFVVWRGVFGQEEEEDLCVGGNLFYT
mmetsp:Transcript_20977/g.52034  ORF Transcript_20977/g.52034 Transcript_20977/m.52034 type:complete len:92 (-) Transcript_20977:217-492(-)